MEMVTAQEKEFTYVASVRVKITSLATIGRFLQQTGLYTAAKPSGALAYALELFVSLIEGQEYGQRCSSVEEALITIGALHYPTDQLEKQVAMQEYSYARGSVRQQTVEKFGPVASGLVGMKRKIQSGLPLTEEEIAEVKGNAAKFLNAQPLEGNDGREQQVREKATIMERAKAAGVVSDDTRSAEEINAERAALDAARIEKERAANLEMIRLAGLAFAQPPEASTPSAEDEFGEFHALAEEIVAAQPYVVNADPAPAEPGMVVTQEELRKEREMIDDS